jgi:hypothetical protein
MQFKIIFGAILASLLGFGFVVYTFERPPVATVQQGFRGTSMGQVVNQRLTALGIPNNTAPEPLEAADPEARAPPRFMRTSRCSAIFRSSSSAG